MYAVTYSLRYINYTDSEQFYIDVEIFTDEVISEIDNLTENIVNEYTVYSIKKQYSIIS